MAGQKHREEVINVKIADALARRGLDADAESIHSKGRPDVLVDLNGIKLVVEGRHYKQAAALAEDAKTRIKKGLGDISLSVEYHDTLFGIPSTKLEQVLEKSQFSGFVFHYRGTAIDQVRFDSKSLDDLADIIRNVFGLIVQEDVVRSQVDKVEGVIDEVVAIARTTNLFFKSETVKKRLQKALAIES